MTATTVARLTPFCGIVPAHGSVNMAASILLLKGQLVTADSDGNADVPTAGQDAIGVACSTVDNRNGLAGDLMIELDYGEHEYGYSGTAPKMGNVVYVLDNQTVTLDGSGSKGIAGFCTQTGSGGKTKVWIGPHVSSAYADPTAAEAKADDALARLVLIDNIEIPVPLGSFRLATGAAVAAFTNGSVDGFSLVDSEAFGIRWNDDVFTAFWADVKVPEDLDTGASVTLNFLVSKIGSTDTTAVLTVSAFRNRVGVAHDAGSDLGGNTSAIASATKTPIVKSVTLTGLAAGDNISFSVVPSAALDDDDLVLLACWLSCQRDVIA